MQSSKSRQIEIVDLYPRSFQAVGRNRIGVAMKKVSSGFDRWHRHNGFYEIVICCSGSAYCEGPDGGFVLRPGNVLFFPDGAEHRYSGIRSFRYYNLQFGSEFFSSTASIFSFLPRLKERFFPADGKVGRKFLNESDMAALVAILESMRAERVRRNDGWEDQMFAECSRALIFLMRHASDDMGSTAGAFQIGKAVRMIENSSGVGITVQHLAEAVKMSQSSFRHRFRTLLGVSPMEYLLTLRLKRSVMALAADASISEAAEHGGFNDVNYFCRQFRKRLGCTPLTYRRRIQQGAVDPMELFEVKNI